MCLIPKPIYAVLGREIHRMSDEVLAMSNEELAEVGRMKYDGREFYECHEEPSALASSWIATYISRPEKILNAINEARQRGIKGLCFRWGLDEALAIALGRLLHERYAEWIEENGGAAEVQIRSEINGVPIMGTADAVFCDGEYMAVAEVKSKATRIAEIQAAIYAYALSKLLGDTVIPYVVNTYVVKKVKDADEIMRIVTGRVGELWNLVLSSEEKTLKTSEQSQK